MIKNIFDFKKWTLIKFEIISLGLLLFFLPNFEAPKNLFLLSYLIFGLIRHFKNPNFLKIKKIDYIFLILLISLLLSTIFSAYTGDEWHGLRSGITMILFGWLLARSEYSKKTLNTLFVISILSVIPTILFGFYELFWLKKFYFLKLHSVGHVNASGIYLATVCGGVLAISLVSHERTKKYFFLVTSLFFYIALLFVQSRSAFLEFLIASLIIILIINNQKKLYLFGFVSLIFISFLAHAPVFEKQMLQHKQGDVLAERDKIWNVALEAIKSKSTFFGIGPNNYYLIDSNFVKKNVEGRGELYDSTHYKYSTLTHNVYLSFLIERGLFGFFALIALMIFWLQILFKIPKYKNEYFFLWGASLSAFLSIFLAGLFHTTLIHEPGILALFFFGLHYIYSSYFLTKHNAY